MKYPQGRNEIPQGKWKIWRAGNEIPRGQRMKYPEGRNDIPHGKWKMRRAGNEMPPKATMKWLRHFISYFYWGDWKDCAGNCLCFIIKVVGTTLAAAHNWDGGSSGCHAGYVVRCCDGRAIRWLRCVGDKRWGGDGGGWKESHETWDMSQKTRDRQLLDSLASAGQCLNIDCELKTQPITTLYSPLESI